MRQDLCSDTSRWLNSAGIITGDLGSFEVTCKTGSTISRLSRSLPTMRGCKQRRPPLLTQTQNLDHKDNHGCTTVPLPLSARLVSSCLKFNKSSNSTCATNFQQTKISPRQWTHSACPSTQFMITKREHIQKLAKEASDRARQAYKQTERQLEKHQNNNNTRKSNEHVSKANIQTHISISLFCCEINSFKKKLICA